MQAKQKLVDEKADIMPRIDIAKRQKGKGVVCHNCHMRLGHTARNCTFEQCNSIYSCGEEKLHPAENSRLKQMRQSISKMANKIGQLDKELENRQAAVDEVNSSKTNRIETELLEADDEHIYIQNGVRNWQLLRKHVYAIEGYCKKI